MLGSGACSTRALAGASRGTSGVRNGAGDCSWTKNLAGEPKRRGYHFSQTNHALNSIAAQGPLRLHVETGALVQQLGVLEKS